MKSWQRIFVISGGVGAGAILAAGLVILSVVWYSARPKHPAPWNGTAIKARYDKLDTGATSHGQEEIRFYYVVTNETGSDYKVEQADLITMMGKLEDERSLLKEERITIDCPFFIPAKQSALLTIHVPNFGFKEAKPDRQGNEYEKYVEKLIQYVNEDMRNLDGFVLYDNSTRYQINFPNGWRQKR